jgi:hypothetical protein
MCSLARDHYLCTRDLCTIYHQPPQSGMPRRHLVYIQKSGYHTLTVEHHRNVVSANSSCGYVEVRLTRLATELQYDELRGSGRFVLRWTVVMFVVRICPR